MAGASAIQVGTANFSNPHAAKQILDGLHSYAGERGIAIRDLIGKAQR
jgi:dihydroorotate dehydrogenase (NAD+) catalytic subunit